MKTCDKKIPDYAGYHFYACGRPAKYTRMAPNMEKEEYLCGIHARRYIGSKYLIKIEEWVKKEVI